MLWASFPNSQAHSTDCAKQWMRKHGAVTFIIGIVSLFLSSSSLCDACLCLVPRPLSPKLSSSRLPSCGTEGRGRICSGPGLWALAAAIVGEAAGGEVGASCWEQLRNEPRTSAGILCALELARPSSWHPLRRPALFLGPGGRSPGLRTDCQRGRETAAGSSVGLLSVGAGRCGGRGGHKVPAALLIRFV